MTDDASSSPAPEVLLPNWLEFWTTEERHAMQQKDTIIQEIVRLKTLFHTKPSKSELVCHTPGVVTNGNY